MKRRCVIVWWPDFDAPGADGIEAAEHHAKQLQQIAKTTADNLKKQGAPPEVVKAAREELKKCIYAVRKVDL